MREPKKPYESHDSLVAEIAELKASFSQQRLDNLVAEINSLQHQIKTLRVRNEKDVEEIDGLKGLGDFEQLGEFYDVTNKDDLIRIQAKHVERLQAKTPKPVDQFQRTPREG